ncbi:MULTISPECIES: aspartoacylase [unclassified Arsukibacterium]|uniref:aspartoacylase n=1 Tax=unclassified Arsukibacterium TaxID=2635278 RepID=UPI000C91F67C|nr:MULTISPECIES: aspartoacylase [unclassified Arsukibacterium]MAA95488.1 aspartoacylase [Rheinheimera sp.]HAW92730.1 aspartoacylase [Candidatus Azambacteria bacterium]|tara:strand:+ start:49187 stop:50077 length:891 start_codon:yes stop_codon:yes gene_type:complete
MDKIKQVAIVGGVHGNEFSGIYLVKQYQARPELINRASFESRCIWANPEAHYANKRYLHSDLNRQFKNVDLANPTLSNYEQSRAKVLNAELGPKGAAKTDLLIDLHNTTSNMGACLILTQAGPFYNQLAAYVKMVMPEAIISRDEDHFDAADHALMCTLGRYGVLVEVGPQPQSVLRHDILDLMDRMTRHILDFVELYNTGKLRSLPKKTEAFRYLYSIKLPMNEQGERLGMVHQNVQDKDYQPINPGDPIFMLFDGTEVYYEGEQTVYPTFINEAAYYDNNLAMSLNEKVVITLD